jgi:hypothetical protein
MVRIAVRCFACFFLLVFCASQETPAQAEARFRWEGLESRPWRLSEYHPLSATRSVLAEGQVSTEGEVTLNWPLDGRLHFLEWECAGIQWSLPVCGPYVEGAELVQPAAGRAPFSARPGEVMWDGVMSPPWTPIALARAEVLVEEYAGRVAADVQQSLLWGESSGGARDRAADALGSPMGQGETGWDSDSLQVERSRAFTRALDSLVKGVPEGAARDWARALRWRVLPEMNADSLAAFRTRWQQAAAPDPEDAAAVFRFRQGLDRFADVNALGREERQRLGRAWMEGDLEGLAEVTAAWWGIQDLDRTAAWFLARLGDGGLGYSPPLRFGRGMPLPPPVEELLAELVSHPLLGVSAERLIQHFSPPGPLSGRLRVFSGQGDLVRMEELSTGGAVVWLWVDASAPSTTVQLQVLERMLQTSGRRGRNRGQGEAWTRDLTWVVVDAGLDWSAYERCVRSASERNGGPARMPYRMVHTGGDIRWTEAFEIRALPSMRYSGPGWVPVRSEPPLPGPALMDWLSRRP